MRAIPVLRRVPLVAAIFLAACALPGRVRPVDVTPDLAGAWEFDIDVGKDTTHGAFALERKAEGYTGELTTNRGTNRLPIRSLTLVRDSVAMIVDSPNGTVTFLGRLETGACGMAGTVLYHNGARYPMVVRRR